MMPDKSSDAGQPSLEKLSAEGVQIRKCIAMGDSYGGNGGSSSGGSKPAKATSAPRSSKSSSGY